MFIEFAEQLLYLFQTEQIYKSVFNRTFSNSEGTEYMESEFTITLSTSEGTEYVEKFYSSEEQNKRWDQINDLIDTGDFRIAVSRISVVGFRDQISWPE